MDPPSASISESAIAGSTKTIGTCQARSRNGPLCAGTAVEPRGSRASSDEGSTVDPVEGNSTDRTSALPVFGGNSASKFRLDTANGWVVSSPEGTEGRVESSAHRASRPSAANRPCRTSSVDSPLPARTSSPNHSTPRESEALEGGGHDAGEGSPALGFVRPAASGLRAAELYSCPAGQPSSNRQLT